MQLVLLPENASFNHDEKQRVGTSIREKLLRRSTDRKNIRKVKLEENSFLACLVLQLGNRFFHFLRVARREVDLRVAHQQLLHIDEHHKIQKWLLKNTLTVSFPIPVLPPTPR
jgi:hypothetical protein